MANTTEDRLEVLRVIVQKLMDTVGEVMKRQDLLSERLDDTNQRINRII